MKRSGRRETPGLVASPLELAAQQLSANRREKGGNAASRAPGVWRRPRRERLCRERAAPRGERIRVFPCPPPLRIGGYPWIAREGAGRGEGGTPSGGGPPPPGEPTAAGTPAKKRAAMLGGGGRRGRR